MKMTNDTYCVVVQGKEIRERYYRDARGWLKVSNRGREFRATAEQVLNHLLPALAFGDELGLTVSVEHYDRPYWETIAHPEQATAKSSTSTPRGCRVSGSGAE